MASKRKEKNFYLKNKRAKEIPLRKRMVLIFSSKDVSWTKHHKTFHNRSKSFSRNNLKKNIFLTLMIKSFYVSFLIL